MIRGAAFLWLALMILAAGYLSLRIYDGFHFRTDLMALLPREDQNPILQKANDMVTKAISRRVVVLIGDKNKEHARAAALIMQRQLASSGLLEMTTDGLNKDQLQEIGKFYFPFRNGLLADEDRDRLKAGKGQEIAQRALSQIYGVMGLANAKLLQNDPFLLMPSYMMNLPVPLSRLSLDDGMLSLEDKGTTWILIAGQLRGEPYDLKVQEKITTVYDAALKNLKTQYTGLQALHLGAVFFAKAGAEEAMHETSTIGVASTLGIVLLVLLIFRTIRPLLLNLLVIGMAVLAALAASLLIFGELHVGALLFGVSLIGVAVDYGLQYCSEIFSPFKEVARLRLRRVFIGISLATATCVTGYLTLLLAPFPGLHQIAAFSAIGLLAAWITVVLWLPALDHKTYYRAQPFLGTAQGFMTFWDKHKYRRLRLGLLGLLFGLGIAGYLQLQIDDDVRHLQSLSSNLVSEQDRIQKLIGPTTGIQFFVVQGADTETVLQSEEMLIDQLRPLVGSGALAGFQAPSQYLPSLKRQLENRQLVKTQLYTPLLAQQTASLDLKVPPQMLDEQASLLMPGAPGEFNTPLKSLSNLLLEDTKDSVTHIVSLDAVKKPDLVRKAAEALPGIAFIDPVGDFSNLLAKYRSRAVALLGLSALLMAPLLLWRYGLRKGFWILVPPLLAVSLTPALRAIVGGTFTFFDAMGLVLILSIGVDYAIFCAETSAERKPVTMLAVALAACTALMSFGLLALSDVAAVHNFGATMSVGILLSLLFAPMGQMASKQPPIRTIASFAFLFLLCSCASNPQDQLPSGHVRISPEVNVALPDVSQLGRSIEVMQLVTAHYGEQSFAFNARISATPGLFRMVCLDMMGRKMISIDWTKDDIEYEAASWVPAQLRAENILTDMVLLYWPTETVRKSLEPKSVILKASSNSRKILFKDKLLFKVDYKPSIKNDHWSGTLHYSNLAWGYHFDVQSVGVKP